VEFVGVLSSNGRVARALVDDTVTATYRVPCYRIGLRPARTAFGLGAADVVVEDAVLVVGAVTRVFASHDGATTAARAAA
jgi:hypothetical protein